MSTHNTSEWFRLALYTRLAEWKDTRDQEDLDNFRETYFQLTKKIDSGYTGGHLEVALDFFIPFCEERRDNYHYRPNNTITYMMPFLCEKECLDIITEKPDGDRALAWFSCTVASAYIYPVDSYTEQDRKTQKLFCHMLQNWTGKSISPTEIPNMEVVVRHLFGDACWDLYGADPYGDASTSGIDDVKLHMKCVNVQKNIFADGLPLAFLSTEDTLATPLPPDLSI